MTVRPVLHRAGFTPELPGSRARRRRSAESALLALAEWIAGRGAH
ncbi:hypothetical protein ACFWHG_14575 [Streptomyces microflavus]